MSDDRFCACRYSSSSLSAAREASSSSLFALAWGSEVCARACACIQCCLRVKESHVKLCLRTYGCACARACVKVGLGLWSRPALVLRSLPFSRPSSHLSLRPSCSSEEVLGLCQLQRPLMWRACACVSACQCVCVCVRVSGFRDTCVTNVP